MAPKKAADKGKEPMVEAEEVDIPQTRRRTSNTGVVIRETSENETELPRPIQRIAAEIRDDRHEMPAVTSVGEVPVQLAVQSEVPDSSRATPGMDPQVAVMMETMLSVMRSVEGLVRSQQQRQTSVDEGRLTWTDFLEKFYCQVVPESERSRRTAEFMTLIQGRLTVAEYAAKFCELMRFMPWVQVDQREVTRKFQEGLRPSIRRGVTPFRSTEYWDVLDRALTIEREEEETIRLRERRKDHFPDRQGKKPKTQSRSTEISMSRGLCFRCGQPGHKRADCPQLHQKTDQEQMSRPTQSRSQRSWQRPFVGICYACGQPGHRRFECPQLQRDAPVPRVQQQSQQRLPFRPPLTGSGSGRGRGGGSGPVVQTQQSQVESVPRTVVAVLGQEAQAAEDVVAGNVLICE